MSAGSRKVRRRYTRIINSWGISFLFERTSVRRNPKILLLSGSATTKPVRWNVKEHLSDLPLNRLQLIVDSVSAERRVYIPLKDTVLMIDLQADLSVHKATVIRMEGGTGRLKVYNNTIYTINRRKVFRVPLNGSLTQTDWFFSPTPLTDIAILRNGLFALLTAAGDLLLSPQPDVYSQSAVSHERYCPKGRFLPAGFGAFIVSCRPPESSFPHYSYFDGLEHNSPIHVRLIRMPAVFVGMYNVLKRLPVRFQQFRDCIVYYFDKQIKVLQIGRQQFGLSHLNSNMIGVVRGISGQYNATLEQLSPLLTVPEYSPSKQVYYVKMYVNYLNAAINCLGVNSTEGWNTTQFKLHVKTTRVAFMASLSYLPFTDVTPVAVDPANQHLEADGPKHRTVSLPSQPSMSTKPPYRQTDVTELSGSQQPQWQSWILRSLLAIGLSFVLWLYCRLRLSKPYNNHEDSSLLQQTELTSI